MLYAIGAGDQVVAVDTYSNYPAGTPMTDLSGFEPNVEAIVGYDPDLVVVASDRDGIVGALDTVGIPTLLLERATAVEDTYDQLAQLGAATGHAGGGGRPRRRHGGRDRRAGGRRPGTRGTAALLLRAQ